jgi:hypothetical protein
MISLSLSLSHTQTSINLDRMNVETTPIQQSTPRKLRITVKCIHTHVVSQCSTSETLCSVGFCTLNKQGQR